MTALAPDERIRLREAVPLIPGTPTYSTVHRWAVSGLEDPAGGSARVFLRYERVGRSLWTTPAWIREFVGAMTTRHNAARRGRPSAAALAASNPAATWSTK